MGVIPVVRDDLLWPVLEYEKIGRCAVHEVRLSRREWYSENDTFSPIFVHVVSSASSIAYLDRLDVATWHT